MIKSTWGLKTRLMPCVRKVTGCCKLLPLSCAADSYLSRPPKKKLVTLELVMVRCKTRGKIVIMIGARARRVRSSITELSSITCYYCKALELIACTSTQHSTVMYLISRAVRPCQLVFQYFELSLDESNMQCS